MWVDAFALVNLAFLTLDIYLAHSVNQFRSPAEYVPLYFSAGRPVVLLVALVLAPSRARWRCWGSWSAGCRGGRRDRRGPAPGQPLLPGADHSKPGLRGPVRRPAGLHRGRVAAPHEPNGGFEFGGVAAVGAAFALGGFVGNFVFSLTDHAENGFFNPLEWVSVVASALAVGFLTVPLMKQVSRQFVDLCGAVLLFESIIGIWGFLLHARGNLIGPSVHAWDNFIYGAPPMAPLLFPNLMVLGMIAVWR